MIESEYLYSKNFYVLFHDSVNYLEESDKAIDIVDYEKVCRYGRSSIISSVLLLECCANCCIDILDLQSSYKDDIDKLPPLSKYEYFLSYHKKGKIFDRGCTEIQNVAELKNIRDLVVHSKVKKAKWERVNDHTRQASFGETKTLKFPKEYEDWDRNYALLSLRAICSFLDHYFINLCEFDSNIVKKILIGPDKFTMDPKDGVGTPNEWEKYQIKWQLRLEFIGIKSNNAKAI